MSYRMAHVQTSNDLDATVDSGPPFVNVFFSALHPTGLETGVPRGAANDPRSNRLFGY